MEPQTSNLEQTKLRKRLEIACFTLESALTAVRAGADRIEFTTDYTVGGVTPSVEDFDVLRKSTELPIYVLVRPRGGDFCHSEEELIQMEKDIQLFLEHGADGFVVGCLTSENMIDSEANLRLLKAAEGKPVTFHRAFDEVKDFSRALEEVIDLGFSSVLSSGRERTALQGANRLNMLIQQASGRLEIVVGGGVRTENITALSEVVQSSFYHSACITKQGGSADAEEIKRILEVLHK